MNKKGFISTTIVFAFFILFISLLVFIMSSYTTNRLNNKIITNDVKKNDLKVYNVPVVNKINVGSLGISSINIYLDVTSGSKPISAYYYSIDSGITYAKSDQVNYTFSNLNPGSIYRIMAYIEDTNGYKSNIVDGNFVTNSLYIWDKYNIATIYTWRLYQLTPNYTYKSRIDRGLQETRGNINGFDVVSYTEGNPDFTIIGFCSCSTCIGQWVQLNDCAGLVSSFEKKYQSYLFGGRYYYHYEFSSTMVIDKVTDNTETYNGITSSTDPNAYPNGTYGNARYEYNGSSRYKSSFVESVTSTDVNAYPSNGEYNGYWYVKH